jgi:AAA domain
VQNLAEIYPQFREAVENAKADIDAHAERAKAKRPANDNVANTLKLPDQVKADLKERFQITWFDDVDKTTTKEEIVQGVLGAGEFSLFVAKPGMGKSVLVGDIGCHIAAGMDWHGRKVKQGLVVFFAAERKRLTERRVAAWRKKYGFTNIPFVVVSGKLDLTTGLIDAKALSATIKGLEETSRHECVLIILDTVTRTFGPGDQHQSRDMQKYVQSVDELNRATGAHIAAIHHSPWNEDRGKGAIDLDGAIDVSFVVNVKGTGPAKVFTLACTGANDGDDGPITSFRLESVELGTDADGKVTTATVVVQIEPVVTNDGANMKGNAAKALDSLRAVIDEDGQNPPPDAPGFPDGVVVATRDVWRDRFYKDAWAKAPKATEDALSKRFRRAATELKEGGSIGECGQWVWLDMDKAGHGQD